MRLAVSSRPFAGAFAAGTLTHLEWLEGCATRLDADGVVFALNDLPRTDAEYAAQVKKVATDLALVPLALEAPLLLAPEATAAERERTVALGVVLGVVLLATVTGPAGELPPRTFAATVAAAKELSSLAKAANITVVVAPSPGSIAPDAAGLRHLLKDVDSAWLRYALPLGAERTALGPRDRVLLETVDLGALPATVGAGRSWLALGGEGAGDPWSAVASALMRLRTTTAGVV